MNPPCYLDGGVLTLNVPKMLKSLIVAIASGLFIWFIQNHYRDVPTATYSTSDAIEIVGSQGKIESAQEVTVVNSGHSAVKDISIKVPRHVTYKITKHSGLVQEKTFSGDNSFELIYPELPSGQKIRLQIRYDGSPMDKNWISISHADGNSQALENQTPTFNYLWIWLAFMVGVFTQTFPEIRRWKRESFRKWADEKEIFRNDKPWYASSSEWSEMQFEAIERSIRGYSFSAIEQTAYFKLLSRSKPTLLSEEHWARLQKQASESLMERFSKEVTTYSTTEKLADLFKVNKPDAFSISNWAEVQKSLNDRIIAKLLPASMRAEDYVSILDSNNKMLNGLPESTRNKIRELAQNYYADDLTNRKSLELMSDPSAVLQTARLDLLTADQAEHVKNKVLRIARMVAMPSHWSIRELELFISKGRPEWMKEGEFDSISEIVSQAKTLSDERNDLRQQEIELSSKKLEAENLKERVVAQLDLIDRILTNPSSFDRIEDYDKIFAPGNRKNLELVASLLKSA